MREIKIYLFESIFAIAVCIALFFLVSRENGMTKDNYIEWKDGWTVSDGERVLSQGTVLPRTVDALDSNLYLTRMLEEEDCKSNSSLAFITVHTRVKVYVENECIYSTFSNRGTHSKSAGHQWNIIPLEQQYAGKEMVIYFEQPYNTAEITVPILYLGDPLEITSDYVKSKMFDFIISVFMILIGGLLLVVYLTVGKENRIERRMLWIGLFSIALGVWSVMETNILILFVKTPLLLSQISFLCLKLAFTPAMMFFVETFKDRKRIFFKGICHLSLMDVIVTSLLQIFAIADYRETIWLTHFYMFLGVGYILVWISVKYVKEFLAKREIPKFKRTVNSVGFIFMAICILIDFARYYSNVFHEDSAKFSRIGLLTYILILGIGMVQNSLHLVEVEREAEKLKQEALLDAVTHLGNRNSFELEVNKIPKEELDSYGIIMCDLNGLKYFNDNYGHSMGDSYIIISAEMIYDAFFSYGRTFRIGGDEFAVLTNNLNEGDFARIYEQMNEKIDSLSKSYFEERMGVAAGFANFDSKSDSSLFDTEKRADEKMYKQKQKMKEKNRLLQRSEDAPATEGTQVTNPMLKKNGN